MEEFVNVFVSSYAALVATFVAIIQFIQWKNQRVGARLSISPRTSQVKSKRCEHIGVDIQATQNPTSICAIYIAAYKSWWHYLLGKKPNEIVGNEWRKIFPLKIEPGHGWEGLLAINDKERSLAASYNHVRVMVRHTGYGRVISQPITKYLRA